MKKLMFVAAICSAVFVNAECPKADAACAKADKAIAAPVAAESAATMTKEQKKAAFAKRRAELRARREAADKAADDYAKRAAETIRQAARDTVLSVEKSVTALLEKILKTDVDAALSNPATLAGLAAGAVEDLTRTAEVLANSKFVAGLKAQLASKPNITVVTDDALGTGFTVKVDGGRIEHSFTGEVIAAELAKRLRPDLAKLIG